MGLESVCLGQTNQFTKVDATPRPATSDVAAIELRFGREFDRRLTDSRVDKFSTWLVLLLLTGAAVLLHGYHPYVEDAEIYLPGIERILNPQLFPTGQKFFQSHASMSLFSNLVAYSVRATHLSLESGLFLWHVASIFLLLLACWELTSILFSSARARWGGVCLIAGLLTIPIAGTALYIMDQYLNARNLAAFAAVFAVARTLQKKYLQAALWILFAASVHPLMWVFPFSFCALWMVLQKIEGNVKAMISNVKTSPIAMACLSLAWIPLVSQFSPAYHEAATLHANHYIQNWEWYEWLGIVAPLGVFWWLGRMVRTRQQAFLARVCRAFLMYGLIYVAVSLVLDLPARFESLARLQPMRSLHLLYIFLFLCLGGLLGEYALRKSMWRWMALFVPLSLGMFVAQRSLFPASVHLEWPGRAAKNPWAQAFVWIRQNTPVNAVFALDPGYMHIEGEDEIGFRCLAQRSRLADAIKDNGVVSMFPLLADEWWAQVQAQTPWKHFRAADFERLRDKYGVTWIIVEQPGVPGIDCEYKNSTLQVCRLPASAPALAGAHTDGGEHDDDRIERAKVVSLRMREVVGERKE